MTEYFRILYLTSLVGDGKLASDIEHFRNWMWLRSANVRWSTESKLPPVNPELIILDWNPNDGTKENAEKLIDRMKVEFAGVPTLLMNRSPADLPPELGERLQIVVPKDLDACSDSDFQELLRSLGCALPEVTLQLEYDSTDPAVVDMLQWVGEERLALTIQKFFPDANKADVWPVGGGWSGTRLCQVYPHLDGSTYFLKFFKDRNEFKKERDAHAGAKAWLGHYVVDLCDVRDLDSLDQEEPFPIEGSLSPICYAAAATLAQPREMLSKLYRAKNAGFVRQSFEKLCGALMTGQPQRPCAVPETPWSFAKEVEHPWNNKVRMEVLDCLDDLDAYGPALYGGSKPLWEELRHAISRVLHGSMPSWLNGPGSLRPFVRGSIHGDPNPRNCLVLRDNAENVLFIDCGGYRDDGRLVSDIALIERDIKLLLMGTEDSLNGFRDLDPSRLQEWCNAERDSIACKLEYAPNQPALDAIGPSVARAYPLVALMREQAKALSGDWDPDGRHYFAALLYWTLDVLQYPSVRRTKKLLALYSAGEILRLA